MRVDGGESTQESASDALTAGTGRLLLCLRLVALSARSQAAGAGGVASEAGESQELPRFGWQPWDSRRVVCALPTR